MKGKQAMTKRKEKKPDMEQNKMSSAKQTNRSKLIE